jgi:hypothetical protein
MVLSVIFEIQLGKMILQVEMMIRFHTKAFQKPQKILQEIGIYRLTKIFFIRKN